MDAAGEITSRIVPEMLPVASIEDARLCGVTPAWDTGAACTRTWLLAEWIGKAIRRRVRECGVLATCGRRNSVDVAETSLAFKNPMQLIKGKRTWHGI